MPEAIPFDLPFDEAIAFFRAKGFAFSPDSWRDVWREAHTRAFTVARVTVMDVLRDIRSEVQKALDSGISVQQFKKDLVPLLRRKGWFAPSGEKAMEILPDGTVRKRLTPWRLENIYRSNLQTAYSVGRYRQQVEVAGRRPYWQYKAVLDSRTRLSHAAQNNKVYDHRHPFWSRWYPPNGFNCRCYVKTLSAEDVRQRRLTIETGGTDFLPDAGWDYNPGETALDAWQPDWSKVPPELLGIAGGGPPAVTPAPLGITNLLDLAETIIQKLGSFATENGIKDVQFKDIGKNFMGTNGHGKIFVSTSVFPQCQGLHPAKDLLSAFGKLGVSPLTFNEEYSVESLWHEILHNAQKVKAHYPAYYYTSHVGETVNQWIARRTYQQALEALGGFKPIHQEAIKSSGYGYRRHQENFARLLEKLGLGENDILQDMVTLHRTVDAYEYAEPLARLLSLKAGVPERELAVLAAIEEISEGEAFTKLLDKI